MEGHEEKVVIQNGCVAHVALCQPPCVLGSLSPAGRQLEREDRAL